MRRSNYIIESVDDTTMTIRDIGPWDTFTTVTNNVENVVKQLHLDGLSNRILYYYDSEDFLDEIKHDGNGTFICFKPAI